MPDIKDKIFSKIDHQKPTDPNYFLAVDILRALGIALIFFLAGVVLAFFLWDWVLIPGILYFAVDNLGYIVFNLFPLVLFLIVTFSFLGYYLYRQTDWPLVTKRNLLLILAILFIFMVTAATLTFIQYSINVQRSLRQIDRELQRYPIRPPRPRLPIEQQILLPDETSQTTDSTSVSITY